MAKIRVLTEEADADRSSFEYVYGAHGCTCFRNPPCGFCTPPGNPLNQEEDEECWKLAGEEHEIRQPFLHNGLEIAVYQSLLAPKVQLNYSVTVSNAVRDEMNEWLDGFFGRREVEMLRDGDVIRQGDTLFVNKNTFDRIKTTGKAL